LVKDTERFQGSSSSVFASLFLCLEQTGIRGFWHFLFEALGDLNGNSVGTRWANGGDLVMGSSLLPSSADEDDGFR
jgi:hypothetical protein